MDQIIPINSFLTLTLGIIVYFVGIKLTDRVGFLQRFNIPEPVTGGIIASVLALILYLAWGQAVEFDLSTRDTLLVYFFTTIGLNARFSDLKLGGRPLAILLILTIAFLILQDGLGYLIASAIGLPGQIGVLTGSASLMGGHGTAIAWSPVIAEATGVSNAMEIGIASATIGLVIASLIGGPIAKLLLARHKPELPQEDDMIVGLSRTEEDSPKAQITHINIMTAILVMHIAIIIGYIANEAIKAAGINLPLFVSCMFVAIIMSNTVPFIFKKMVWPARTKALAVIADFSLSLFIAMSLMSMQLWSVADLAGPLFYILSGQVLMAVLFILFVVFPLMGRDYLAVVISSGFAGFSLGATPTAIANMSAVTKTHGPAPTAFLILPLVGAFFVDIANALVIQFFMNL